MELDTDHQVAPCTGLVVAEVEGWRPGQVDPAVDTAADLGLGGHQAYLDEQTEKGSCNTLCLLLIVFLCAPVICFDLFIVEELEYVFICAPVIC